VKKAYRIKKNSEIEALMKHKQSVGNGFLTLYHYDNERNDHFRYAISVPKKYGSAVMRNKIKRRIREIVRPLGIHKQVDFFIVVKPKANTLDFLELKEMLIKIFARAKIIEG
jgi:ribonuclease P protein component